MSSSVKDNKDKIAENSINIYSIPEGLARYMFISGTEEISWLDTWRQTKVYDSENRYVKLDMKMYTLRQVAKDKKNSIHGHGQAAKF